MNEQLLETWHIHDRIHHYLLGAIPAEALAAVSASKGRSVAEQFAHIHNVRLLWLRSAAPDLVSGVAKLEKPARGAGSFDAGELHRALEASGAAVATLLTRSFASGGRIKGFKPHAVAFLGYLVSHESHHRGQIVLTLKQSGHLLDKAVAYGLWEWGVR
jgi:uncharacterized damage-inducible protein DinB